MKLKDIQECISDLKDVHYQLHSHILARPKYNDWTGKTIGDCLENAIKKLQKAEVKKLNKTKQ